MGRRIAILVGNASFTPDSQLEALRGPPNDVAALAEVLGDPERGGFEVRQFVDARKDAVLPTIDEVLNTVETEDLVLLFYAGHGKLDPSGRLCLATAETRAAALRSTSIPVSELKELVAQSRAGSVVLLLDCCFSGAISKEFRSGGVDDQLALMRDAQGLHILTAATGLQTARERDAEAGGVTMGAFTRVIVEGIRSGAADRDGDGQISLSDLRRHVGETLRGQTPKYLASDASGEPLIARSRPPQSKEQKRLRRLGQWYNEGKIPEALYPAISDAAGGEGDRHLVELVQRVLDNKEMRARQLVAAWEAAVNPPPAPEPEPTRPKASPKAPRWTGPADPPAPGRAPAPATTTLMGTLRLPLILVGVGIVGFFYGVFEMNAGVEEDGVLILLGAVLVIIGGGVWGALRFVRHLGAAVRRIGSG